MKLSVSFLGKENYKEILELIDKENIDYIHADIMDGKYVPKTTIREDSLYSMNHKFDTHLMVKEPSSYIDGFSKLNTEFITIHLDIDEDIDMLIDKIKGYGIKVGIAINPNQPIELVYPYLEKIDLVLIMTVVPGLPGQEIIVDATKKIVPLKNKISELGLNIIIETDGGINDKTIDYVKDSNMVVCGSFITNGNIHDRVDFIKNY